MPAELNPAEVKELIAQLDDVCRQAQELSAQLRQTMIDRARRDQQHLSGNKPSQTQRRRTRREKPTL
jgi:hypothetical protein